MNKTLITIFFTIWLDAIGLGLVFPILPRLLEDVMQTATISPYIGLMAALYALMQFVFAPVLGALSDRFGRRPVLFASLGGAVINYLIMAFSTHFWVLLVGRAIAGLTSANLSVAMAWLTDITPAHARAKRFGLFNAMFGAGFIIGPVMGGVLGDYGIRLPFLVAAALSAGNLLLVMVVLKAPPTPVAHRMSLSVFNPLGPLSALSSTNGLLSIVLIFFFLSATGDVYGACWALWSQDAFQWNGTWIGLSLGAFGICQTLVQALLPGAAARLLGERGAVLTGIGCTCVALAILSGAHQGWVVFAIMPLIAFGNIGSPILQALATRQLDADRQGELQGVLTSAISLASIIAPLFFSWLYFSVSAWWPGAIWIAVIVLYLCAVPFIYRSTRMLKTDNI